jgi:hypothetical protein
MWGLWVSKDAELNVDFKNVQGAPCVVNKIFILDLLFLGAFCL